MIRKSVFEKDYRPQLSGHETFPLRYGWLKKAFDAVQAAETGDNKYVFTGEDAIARFGVGKNMVTSMRHWAKFCGLIEEGTDSKSIGITTLGQLLFSANGLDPYMENPNTSWLVHWRLCGHPAKTTWYWSFNHYPALFFERDSLIRGIEKLAREQNWSRTSVATIRRDVSCFVRTYVAQPVSRKASYEDALESPLTELGLIKQVGRRDNFRFVRGPKPTLGIGVFSYAVIDFWNRNYQNVNTLSFESLAYEPGSPGRVFLLDERDLTGLLTSMEEVTDGVFSWSETGGLKQLIRNSLLTSNKLLDYIKSDYLVPKKKN